MAVALFPWSVFAAALVWMIRREFRKRDSPDPWRKFGGHGMLPPPLYPPVDVLDSARLIRELRKEKQ